MLSDCELGVRGFREQKAHSLRHATEIVIISIRRYIISRRGIGGGVERSGERSLFIYFCTRTEGGVSKHIDQNDSPFLLLSLQSFHPFRLKCLRRYNNCPTSRY